MTDLNEAYRALAHALRDREGRYPLLEPCLHEEAYRSYTVPKWKCPDCREMWDGTPPEIMRSRHIDAQGNPTSSAVVALLEALAKAGFSVGLYSENGRFWELDCEVGLESGPSCPTLMEAVVLGALGAIQESNNE